MYQWTNLNQKRKAEERIDVLRAEVERCESVLQHLNKVNNNIVEETALLVQRNDLKEQIAAKRRKNVGDYQMKKRLNPNNDRSVVSELRAEVSNLQSSLREVEAYGDKINQEVRLLEQKTALLEQSKAKYLENKEMYRKMKELRVPSITPASTAPTDK